MSNSVVTVTDPHKNDSLILVVGEDGTVTPDKDTVETYLNSRTGPTELQVMHVNKLDGANIDVTVDTLMYVHNEEDITEEVVSQVIESVPAPVLDMDEVSRNLMNIQLDHDYTPFTSPKSSPVRQELVGEVDDELANTLRILEGDNNETEATVKLLNNQNQKVVKPALSPVKNVAQPQTKVLPKRSPPAKVKAKMINTNANATPAKTPNAKTKSALRVLPPKPKPVMVPESDEEDDEDFMDSLEDFEDDVNDSDFELDEVVTKPKPKTRGQRSRTSVSESSEGHVTPNKQGNKQTKRARTPKTPKNEAAAVATKQEEEPPPAPPKVEKAPTPPPPEPKSVEKKPLPKKEKKVPKPILDDFALFSTPDIMKRVGGKEPTTPVTPTTPDGVTKQPKPAKITPENRSKSGSSMEKSKPRLSTERRISTSSEKSNKSEKAVVTEVVKKVIEPPPPPQVSQPQQQQTFNNDLAVANTAQSQPPDVSQLDPLPNLDDINNIIQENEKGFAGNNLDLTDASSVLGNADQANMNLETGGLDIDQTLLDNINSELISDDILYQVAKSLVDNTELQNVIDKSISDGNLVLDPSMQQAFNENVALPIAPTNNVQAPVEKQQQQVETPNSKQVFRGGRLITIPPIERPTTRSRNKKSDVEKPQAKVLKPLDDDHVFGSEMESSEEDEEKDDDEDEDDPNKLWCICNTPHNNRFMICCDVCEEWYHGKCVNVTKAMGQMMEQEGKEWICLYCKDKSLTRPTAAARRIRKASRTSTDSQGSSKRSSFSAPEPPNSSDTQCIVCSNPSRNNSIYCSDVCIQKHAQSFKRSIVINRKTGKCLSGADAPSEGELKEWLEKNPGWEVLRTNRQGVRTNLTQSKLKVIKNTNNDGVSLAIQKKGVNIGVLQHAPKNQDPEKVNSVTVQNTPQKRIISVKIQSKTTPQPQLKQIKLIQTPTAKQPTTSTPIKLKPIPAAPKLTPPAPKPAPKENKPIPVKTPKARQNETPSKKEPKAENIRDNVKRTLFEQLTNRVKLAEDFSLSDEEVQNISAEIESQLYKCFGDTGQKYRNKYRSLMFNIKDTKNETLWRRICEKSVNPYQLVRLSPDDLASQELALWREREAKHTLDMIKKSELESLNYNRQMVFKTHKGEQVFEDDRPAEKVDNVDVIANLGTTENAQPEAKEENKRDSSKESEKKSTRHKHHRSRSKERERSRSRGKSRDRSRDKKSHERSRDHKKDHRSRSKDRRRRSRSRDKSRHSDRKRSRSRDRDRHRRSSHKTSKHKKDNSSTTEKLDNRSKEILDKLVDNRILPPLEDRLWKHVPQDDLVPTPNVESDSDHEPSSTVTIPTPPRSIENDEAAAQSSDSDKNKHTEKEDKKKTIKETEDGVSSPPPPTKATGKTEPAQSVWKGNINMVDVAETAIVAEEVSGDCVGLSDELPSVLEVVGRIAPDIVWDYIRKMKSSNSKTISLVRLNAKNVEEKMPYLALYTYLSSRNRLGVVKSNHKAIKDFYIYPLGYRQPIPQALLPINGPGFEEEQRPPLLLGIIVRDRRKRPILDGLPHISAKRNKVETVPPLPTSTSTSARSYTPPPSRDPRLKLPGPSPSLPIPDLSSPVPKSVPEPLPQEPDNDEDAPYSPEDSDPDTTLPPPPMSASTSFIETSTNTFEPFANKFDTIPGLDASSQEIQRKIGELDEGINQCQAEINSLINNKYIASTDIGQSALANISIPSNLQQILENIKSISKTEGTPEYTPAPVPPKSTPSDLTIPLMLPKISSRSSIHRQDSASSSPTIPLNLPKPKPKSSPLISYSTDQPTDTKPASVLSSLSEEELIRKAAEMLGETPPANTKPSYKETSTYRPTFPAPPPPPIIFNTPPPPILSTTNLPNLPKRQKLDLPPVPGLEDEG